MRKLYCRMKKIKSKKMREHTGFRCPYESVIWDNREQIEKKCVDFKRPFPLFPECEHKDNAMQKCQAHKISYFIKIPKGTNALENDPV